MRGVYRCGFDVWICLEEGWLFFILGGGLGGLGWCWGAEVWAGVGFGCVGVQVHGAYIDLCVGVLFCAKGSCMLGFVFL